MKSSQTLYARTPPLLNGVYYPMYEDVVELDDSPECDVDISLVVSRAVARKRAIKPVVAMNLYRLFCLRACVLACSYTHGTVGCHTGVHT
jgi:hypothetical protein